ncbi:trypsin-like peptidase domain-containing protein [Streptomyces cellulosae]|uniref:trypsin-like peptidase domain-containing protein n=1 Tax=Streptomyces cellulosae TaxID=1968 RepID=UPI00224D0F11|nr:trypsin-like peptidase domain-containing protein [Streptomyces cellulosae]WTC60976.1 trypsin-like peptidase domain-containing protein [Streptomyces cellulosae]
MAAEHTAAPGDGPGPNDADTAYAAGLEGITRATAGLVDPADLIQVVRDMTVRVARVEWGGRPVGTGVLVAPDVLLTAGHVLGTALEPGRLPDGLEARFDFRTHYGDGRSAPHERRSAPHERGMRVPLTELLACSPPTDAERNASPLSWQASPDHLDYALLRVGLEPVAGRHTAVSADLGPRGHYLLEPDPYDFHHANLLIVVHHPLGEPTRISYTTAPVVINDEGTRIRYQNVNTTPGSSGGPVVDLQGRLVGVHHYAAGGVNQGVPASAIARSVASGPHARILDPRPPAPSRSLRAASAVMLSWVPQDRPWADLVHDALAASGHQVLMGPSADRPGHRTVREHVDGGGKVLALVSPAYLADPAMTDERDHIVHDFDHASAPSRLVPVLVEGEISGSLALLSPVDLREAPAAPGTGQQGRDFMREVSARLAAALGAPASAPAGPPAPAFRESALGFRPGDPLPRLRLLSDRARRSAGIVSGTVFADGEESQFAAGLYVTRDLEEELLERLDTDALTPVVVVGEAGCGKTSILWSLARRRCETVTGEVFFLKATWLVTSPSGAARVAPGMLVEAIRQAHADRRTVTVLIDTVDVLVNNEDDWERLVTVVHTAQDAGAAVVMTSRVAEAAELPPEWRRLPLSDYATSTETGPHTTSEFERAVLAHSRFFTNDPQQREDLISRMLKTAARDISLHPLCLRPLTLRMLFEIYTPEQVPEVVDTTGLYETYWDHRVTRDRRSWGPGGNPPDHGRDLGGTAVTLALEMLRTGRPEAWVDRVRLPAGLTAARLKEETGLLHKRGVGHFANGVFQFFHQTFFEYAASHALVHGRGAAGLGALVERLQEGDGEDYFLLAVLEQAWLCADRRQDAADAAAATVGKLLKTVCDDLEKERTTVRYGLRRAVLSVCAQSSLPTQQMLTDLLQILGSPRLTLPALRQFLELLPAPGRGYASRDADCLKAAVARPDNAWLAVLEVLDRLLPRDPRKVVGTVRTTGLVERATRGGHELSTRGEFADFLVRLLPARPAEAFPLVRSVVRAALAADNHQYAADVLSRMAASSAAHGEPRQWAYWADELLGDTRVSSSALIKAHTNVQLPYLCTLAFPELVDRLTELLPRMSAGPGPTTADRSLLGGLLTAAAHVCPPDAEPGPLVDLLVRITRKEQVADLSRGSLVRLLDSDSPVGRAVRDLAVDWLVQGMPIADRHDQGLADIRAKVVRTALEQLDLPAHRVADVAGRAADAWEPPDGDPVQAWRSTGCLLPLLVRGAVAGVPEAAATLGELPGGFTVTEPDVAAWVEPYYKRSASTAETGVMMDLLVRIGELRQAKTMLVNGVALDDASLTRLAGSALGTLRAAVPPVRPGAMSHEARTRLKALAELLVVLSRRGTVLDLSWTELADWIDRVPDPLALGWLVELVGAGLERRKYPPADALRLLRAQCGADDTLDGASELGRKARLWCVWWYSVYGAASDIPEALRLAFHEPVDAHTVIKASNFAFPDRRDTPLTEDECASLLLDVGRRLRASTLGSGRRKDVAQAWRAAMWSFVPGGSADTQLRIVRELPLLDDVFAAHLLQCVPVNRTPELRAALRDVASRPDLGARLQRAVHQVLDQYKRHSSEGGWPGLFADLARAGG